MRNYLLIAFVAQFLVDSLSLSLFSSRQAEDAKCASCGTTHSSSDALWENALATENSAEGLLESANNFRKNGDILFIKLQSIMSVRVRRD